MAGYGLIHRAGPGQGLFSPCLAPVPPCESSRSSDDGSPLPCDRIASPMPVPGCCAWLCSRSKFRRSDPRSAGGCRCRCELTGDFQTSFQFPGPLCGRGAGCHSELDASNRGGNLLELPGVGLPPPATVAIGRHTRRSASSSLVGRRRAFASSASQMPSPHDLANVYRHQGHAQRSGKGAAPRAVLLQRHDGHPAPASRRCCRSRPRTSAASGASSSRRSRSRARAPGGRSPAMAASPASGAAGTAAAPAGLEAALLEGRELEQPRQQQDDAADQPAIEGEPRGPADQGQQPRPSRWATRPKPSQAAR